jgi:hypothetical protein
VTPRKLSSVPAGNDYAAALAAAKTAIQSAQTRAVLAVNSELIGLYWDLGRLILDRQAAEAYGTKVVERLSIDLRREFPQMRGLSPGNLDYMRRLAAAWPDREVSLQLVGKVNCPAFYIESLRRSRGAKAGSFHPGVHKPCHSDDVCWSLARRGTEKLGALVWLTEST